MAYPCSEPENHLSCFKGGAVSPKVGAPVSLGKVLNSCFLVCKNRDNSIYFLGLF